MFSTRTSARSRCSIPRDVSSVGWVEGGARARDSSPPRAASGSLATRFGLGRNLTPPRVSRFLSDGTHVGTDPVRVEVDYRTTMGVQGISGYLRGGRAWMEPDGLVMAPDGVEATSPFMVGDRNMEARSTLFSWRAGRGRLAGISFEPISEPPFHDVAPDGSGVALANWSEARPEVLLVRFFSPAGAEVRSWTFTLPPVPIHGSVRDSLVEVASEQVSDLRRRVIAQGVPEELAPTVPTVVEIRDALYIPAYYPPIREIRVGFDGTVWVGDPGTRVRVSWPWIRMAPRPSECNFQRERAFVTVHVRTSGPR